MTGQGTELHTTQHPKLLQQTSTGQQTQGG